MLEEGRITCKQLMMLIIMSRLILAITYIMGLDSPPANQDLWIADLLSFFMHLLIMIPIYLLTQRFYRYSIVESADIILGRAGKVVGLLYAWFFLHHTSLTLRQFGDFFNTVPYQETPVLVFIVSLALVAALAAHKGIEVICRNAQILLPIVLFSVVLVVILVAKDMELRSLTPVLENGIAPVLHGSFNFATRTTTYLFVAMLIPYLNRPKKAKNTMVSAYLVITVFFAIVDITIHTTFGPELSKSLAFPFFSAVRIISVGNFIERLDAVYLGTWVIGTFVRVSAYYYLAVVATAQILNLRDYRPIIIPIGTVIVSLSILQADSMVAISEFINYKVLCWYNLFFTVALPSLLLLVAIVRKKGAQSK